MRPTGMGAWGTWVHRWTAEEVTKRVAGVRAIANDIEVKIPKPGERSDSDIASAAANALKWHFSLESSDIQPVVKQGWITLSGHVSYGYQKTIAEGAVRYLLGVKGVFKVRDTGVAVVADTWYRAKSALDALPIVWDDAANASQSSATIAEHLVDGFGATRSVAGHRHFSTKENRGVL